MTGTLGRWLLVLSLGLLAVLRARTPWSPEWEYVEVHDGRVPGWQRAQDRRVDTILAARGEQPLGLNLVVPPGESLVRRGDGWAVEPATFPQLEGVALDLNRVGESALRALPGVGASTARSILTARPYRTVDELTRARGIGPVLASSLAPHVMVHPHVPPPRPLNVNCVSSERLESLPRVGPVLAKRIVAARPFASVEGLRRVSGVGPATMGRLRPLVRAEECT